MKISPEQHEALLEHAREESPRECCGYMKIKDGRVLEIFRAENAYGSPKFGFEFGFKDLQAANELDDDGFDVGVYHSHPRSDPVPSQQDRNVMQYSTWVQFIVSPVSDPPVRAWWVRDGDVEEEPVELA